MVVLLEEGRDKFLFISVVLQSLVGVSATGCGYIIFQYFALYNIVNLPNLRLQCTLNFFCNYESTVVIYGKN